MDRRKKRPARYWVQFGFSTPLEEAWFQKGRRRCSARMARTLRAARRIAIATGRPCIITRWASAHNRQYKTGRGTRSKEWAVYQYTPREGDEPKHS